MPPIEQLPLILVAACTVVQVIVVLLVHRRISRLERDADKSIASVGTLSRPAEYLATLDSLFFESGEYQALRRMGVSAPLLGVLASAVLLAYGDALTSTEGNPGLPDLQKLFGGVFAGVLVALANQVCLWWVELAYRRARRRAESRLPPSSIDTEMERFTSRLEAMTEMHRVALDAAIAKTSKAAHAQISALVSESQKSIASLSALAASGSETLTQQIAVVKKSNAASDAYANSLNESSKRFNESLNRLDATLGGIASRVDSTLQSLGENAKSLAGESQKMSDRSKALLSTMETSQESVLAGIRLSADRSNQGIEGLISVVQNSDALVRQLSTKTALALDGISDLPKQINAAVSNATDSIRNAARDIQASATTLNASSKQMHSSTEGYAKQITAIVELLSSLADKQLAPLASKTVEALRSHAQQCSDASKALEAASALVLESSQSTGATLARVKESDQKLENAVALLTRSVERSSKSMEDQLTVLRTWPQTTEQMVEHAREFLDQEMKTIAQQMVQIAQVFAAEIQKQSSHTAPSPPNGRPAVIPPKK